MATKFWVSANEDSRANAFRARWASDNKGEWRKQGNLGWNWFPVTVDNNQAKKSVIAEVKRPIVEKTKKVKRVNRSN